MSRKGALIGIQYYGLTDKKAIHVNAGQSNQVGTLNGAPSKPRFT